MKYLILFFSLFFVSCDGIPADKAKQSLIGMTLPDLISCAGKASKVQPVNNTDVVLEYDQDQPVQPNFNLGGIYGVSFGLGAMGTCHTMFRLHNGYVGSIHYTGQTWTIGGKLSACGTIINSCYYRIDHTDIPTNYNQFDVLGVNQP